MRSIFTGYPAKIAIGTSPEILRETALSQYRPIRVDHFLIGNTEPPIQSPIDQTPMMRAVDFRRVSRGDHIGEREPEPFEYQRPCLIGSGNETN